MNIRFRNIPSPVLYTVSAALVLAFFALVNPSETFLRFFVPAAFWTVVALDFWRTQVKENGESEVAVHARVTQRRGVYVDKWGYLRVDWFGSPRTYESATPEPQPETPPAPRSNAWSFADRFLAYLVVAPFILPARLYRLLPAGSGSRS